MLPIQHDKHIFLNISFCLTFKVCVHDVVALFIISFFFVVVLFCVFLGVSFPLKFFKNFRFSYDKFTIIILLFLSLFDPFVFVQKRKKKFNERMENACSAKFIKRIRIHKMKIEVLK